MIINKKAIDFTHFLKIAPALKSILKAVAEQVVAEKGSNRETIEQYLQHCNLVKMDIEKLVIKMELPAELTFMGKERVKNQTTEKKENKEEKESY